MSKKVNTISNYKIKRQIGVGSFATVHLATHMQLGIDVAVKKISKQRINISKNYDRCLNELKLYEKLQHENIIQMFEVEDTPDYFCIFMEYATEGDMHMILSEINKFTEDEARIYFRQLIRGIDYCHINGIVHRDLKLENILLAEGNIIKIADFGLSSFLSGGDFMQTCCGSIRYADPELLRGRIYSGEMADTWSIGVILYAMLIGNLPFEDEVFGFILKKILKNSIDFPDHISPDARDLITRILQPDVNKRISLQEIKMHPWLVRESLGRQLDFQFSYDQMKNYSTYWSQKVKDDIFDKIKNLDFNFQNYNTDESKKQAIKNRLNLDFVIAYQMLFYEKIKQEFRADDSSNFKYIFKPVEQLFTNDTVKDCFKTFFIDYKIKTANSFIKQNYKIGFPCCFSLKKLFKDLLNLLNSLNIKIEIESRDDYEFVCFILDYKANKTGFNFHIYLYRDIDEFFVSIKNDNVPKLQFIMIARKIFSCLHPS